MRTLLVALVLSLGCSCAFAEEVSALVRDFIAADIEARGLPSAALVTPGAGELTRKEGWMLSPDGEVLTTLRDLPALEGKGVALVAVASSRYWVLGRTADAGTVLNGPYGIGADPAAMLSLLKELQDASPRERSVIMDKLLVGPGAWKQVEALLTPEKLGDEGLANRVRRTLTRQVRMMVRARLAKEGEGGFYEGQFAELARFGDWGRQALVRILRDPREDPNIRSHSAQALGDIGTPETVKALNNALKSRAIPQWLGTSTIFALARLGDRTLVEKRIADFKEQIKAKPDDASGYFSLAQVHVRLGESEEALALYLETVQRDPAGSQAGLTWYNIACVYSMAGQSDQAFDALDKAVALGGVDFDWMVKDGDLRSLHADERWEALFEHRRAKTTRRIF